MRKSSSTCRAIKKFGDTTVIIDTFQNGYECGLLVMDVLPQGGIKSPMFQIWGAGDKGVEESCCWLCCLWKEL